MGRSKQLTIEIFVEDNGEAIPYLTIDPDKKVSRFVSEEDQQKYEQKMLKNIGETMSLFYTAHPEYLEKEKNDERKQSA